ncbi:MAG: hypothetical protein AB7F25_00160 [Deferribacterales bacterium]
MKVFFTIALSCVLISHAYAAGSFEDYRKSVMGEYQNYLDEMDRQFSAFLKQQWKEYKGQKPVKQYEEPKPVVQPVTKPEVKPEPVKIVPKPVPAPVVVPAPKPEPVKELPKAETPKPTVKPKEEPAEPKEPQPSFSGEIPEPTPFYAPVQEGDTVDLTFFGLSVRIPYDRKIKTSVQKPISSDNVAKWWESVASADYGKSLKVLDKTAKDASLSDWGYVMLVDRFTSKLMFDASEQKMLAWFFLVKSGYNAKLGYTKSGYTKLMLPADASLYDISFYTFDNKKFYLVNTLEKISTSTDPLYTYKGNYPTATKSVSFTGMKQPKLSFARFDRDLTFEYDRNKYTVKAVANKYDIAYLTSFPQTDLPVYTSASVPQWVDKTVLPTLTTIIQGKSTEESINILLRFVQTAFPYKTDDQQFGKEKSFYAEEIIYYPYSDCEDRSIFFAYLVEKLLKKDVVLLNYPDHVATAVDMGDKTVGAYLPYKGKKYTVADPTYINATVGMVMPQYKTVSPEIEETGI